MRHLERTLLLTLPTVIFACNGEDISEPTTGTLEVSIATTGIDQDPDGYTVQVDAGPALAIGATATLHNVDVSSGSHTLRLAGMASNCAVVGDNPRGFTVAAGETTTVGLEVTCTAPISGKIAFVGSRGGRNDIFTMNTDGTGQRNLTPEAGDEYTPAWSPDGTKIAFLRTGHRGVEVDLLVMNADGSGQTSLSTRLAWLVEPAWSPDGGKIAFVCLGSGLPAQICLINSDGSGARQLTNGPHVSSMAGWSPDGARILFAREYRIFVMNADGDGEASLTSPASTENDRDPQWSPDGRKIAFIRETHDDGALVSNLWVMDVDGTGLKNLTNFMLEAGGHIGGYSWAPDGGQLAFGADLEIYVIRPDGTGKLNLTHNGFDGVESRPVWSPDGTRILFSVADFGWRGPHIGVMDPDGSHISDLSDSLAWDTEPAWQP